MGYAIAQAAKEAGATVELVSGPVALESPYGVSRISVESAAQMHKAVMATARQADVFIAVAAVADWYVSNASKQKLKKNAQHQAPALEFSPNPDILADVAALPQPPYCVGFAAETEKLNTHAEQKRLRKGVPLLVGNLAQRAMNADDTELVLFNDAGHDTWPAKSKLQAARDLIQHIAQQL